MCSRNASIIDKRAYNNKLTNLFWSCRILPLQTSRPLSRRDWERYHVVRPSPLEKSASESRESTWAEKTHSVAAKCFLKTQTSNNVKYIVSSPGVYYYRYIAITKLANLTPIFWWWLSLSMFAFRSKTQTKCTSSPLTQLSFSKTITNHPTWLFLRPQTSWQQQVWAK